MFKPEASSGQLRASVRQLLDIAVDQHCLEFNAVYNQPMPLDADHDLPSGVAAREGNDVFLNFIFVCDARAQIDNPTDTEVPTAWVAIAQNGIRSLARQMPLTQRLERTRLLSRADHADQQQLYEEMAARRTSAQGNELNEPTTGLWYAVRVATGQVVLQTTDRLNADYSQH